MKKRKIIPLLAMLLLSAILVLLGTPVTMAVTVTWNGDGDGGTWSDGNNWDTDSAPGENDDVVIDVAVTVNLTAATTINSLTLGQSGGGTASILNFKYDTRAGASDITYANPLTVSGDVTAYADAYITHEANADGVLPYRVYIDVEGDFTLQGNINVNAKGCPGGGFIANGYGPNETTGVPAQSTSGYGIARYGGAAHGGAGGAGYSGGARQTTTYGISTAPKLPGSGGGGGIGDPGATGGGTIRVNVAGTFDIDGTISANSAAAGNQCGGGAGGSIWISTGTLSGSGSIAAKGGTSSDYGGGGGGGRVALQYLTNTDFTIPSEVTIEASWTPGGDKDAGGRGSEPGEDGSVDTHQYVVFSAPSITSPEASSYNNSVNVPLTSSTAAGDNYATHINSDWKITSDSGGSTQVWYKDNDTINKTSITVNTTNGTFTGALSGETALADSTTYYAFVRYNNIAGDSSWSSAIAFTTAYDYTCSTQTWHFNEDVPGDYYTYNTDNLDINTLSNSLARLTDLGGGTYKAAAAGVLSGWDKRKAITITENSGSTLTNYQVEVSVTYDSDMQADFDDIRFTSSDGSTEIHYWLESKTDSDSAVFWVEVPSITASTDTTIYMYYDNSVASSTSNGSNTFVFFDDFESYSIGDINGKGGWALTKGSSCDVISEDSNQMLQIEGGAAIPKHAVSLSNSGYAFLAYAKCLTANEQITLSMFDGEAATGSAYNEYLNGYNFLSYGWANTKNAIAKGTGSGTTWIVAATAQGSASSGTYYSIEATWEGSSQKLNIDGTEKLSGTNADYTSRDYIGFASWGVTAVWGIDYTHVRKYTSSEPTMSTGSEHAPAVYDDIKVLPSSGGTHPAYSVQLLSFSHSLGGNNAGSVAYQISHNGTNWYYHNGSGWTTASTDSSHNNTVTEVNTWIPDFHSDVGTGSIYFKVFLVSTGSQKVELDSVTVTYDPVPDTPTVSGDTSRNAALTGNSYYGPGSHQSSDWKVTSDAAGDTTVWSVSNDTTNLTSRTVNTSASGTFAGALSGKSLLAASTTYYAWVRYDSSNGLSSSWSSAGSFTTVENDIPNTPTNSSPAAGATDVSLTPMLQSSSFSDGNDPADAHIRSDWYVYEAEDTKNAVWSKTNDGDNLAAIVVNDTNGTFAGDYDGHDELKAHTEYAFNERYQDDQGGWSEYSSTTAFTTTNNAPTSSSDIPDQTLTEDTAAGGKFDLDDFFDDSDWNDNDNFTYSIINDWSSGAMTVNGDGTVDFTPTLNSVASDKVQFRATDGGGLTWDSNEVTINITAVNDTPVFSGTIANQTWTDDTAKTIDLSEYFDDVDSGDSLSYSVSGSEPSNVTVTFSGATATLTPADDWYSGAADETVTFKATDTGSATVESNIITLSTSREEPGGTDTDGDGMPDDYEEENGLDPNDSTGTNGADGDLDGDGVSNYNEYLGGTEANNGESVLKVTATTVSADTGVLIEFPTTSGRYYSIYYGDDLLTWTFAQTVQATEVSTTFTDDGTNTETSPLTSGVTKRFYKIVPSLTDPGLAAGTVVASPRKSTWYAAEGCTAGIYDEWLLIMNPAGTETEVSLTCMLADGQTVERKVTVPATSRYSVAVDDIIPSASVSVKAAAAAGKHIIVERSMYWRNGLGGHNSSAVSEPALTWYLAEGCTAGAFDEWILIMNPNSTAAQVLVTFMKENGETLNKNISVSANSRHTIHVNEIVPQVSLSAKLRSLNGVKIVVERAMYWNSGGVEWVGGHCSTGVTETSDTWYFAEGCTAGFDEWLLVQNPNNGSAQCQVTFMRSDGNPVIEEITVPGTGRYTIYVNDYVANEPVSVKVASINGTSIIAERTMYWDAGGVKWAGGHCSTGVTKAANTWYLAEGCTSGNFALWILLMNPHHTRAQVKVTFMKDDGTITERDVSVGPMSRYTIYVNEIVPDASVSTKVEAAGGVDIIVERAMYWNTSTAVLGATAGKAFEAEVDGTVRWIDGHCSSGIQ